MARLTVTNNPTMHKWALSSEQRAGFTGCTALQLGSLFVAAHAKKRNPVINLVPLENGDLVAACGTFVYEGHLGEGALLALYRSFRGDVSEIRTNASGCYFVALKKGNVLRLFSDKYEGLFTYCYEGASGWFVGNSLSTIAGAVRATASPLEVDEFCLAEAAFVGAVVGYDTMFKQIRRLPGMEYMSVDVHKGQLEHHAIPYSRISAGTIRTNPTKFSSLYAHELKTKTSMLRTLFSEDISLAATGGIDTRLVLASLIASDVSPCILHGTGTGQANDLAIAKQYSARLSLECRSVEWPYCHNLGSTDYERIYHRYGMLGISGRGLGFFDTFEHGIFGSARLLLSGYYGELIRYPGSIHLSSYWQHEFAKPSFTLDKYMEFHMAGFHHNTRDCLSLNGGTMEERVRHKVQASAERYGVSISDNTFARDDFAIVYDPWIRAAHPVWDSIANDFTCSVGLGNMWELRELAFEVPVAWRRNDHFAISVINTLCPELLEMPIVSHTRAVEFKRHSLEVVEPFITSRLRSMGEGMNRRWLGRRVRRVVYPLHLGRVVERVAGGRQGVRVENAAAQSECRNERREDVVKMVEQEQRALGIWVIDPGKYTGGVEPLVTFWKLLFFARMSLEERGSA